MSPFTRALLAASLLTLALVSLGHDAFAAPEGTTNTQLTADQRLEGFVRIWSATKVNFAFFDKHPGFDWIQVLRDYLPEVRRDQSDEEFTRLLSKLLAQLQDGHTQIAQAQLIVGRPDCDRRAVHRRWLHHVIPRLRINYDRCAAFQGQCR